MKLVKKLTALFLAIVMTMAMGITAFADPVETPAAAKTYKLTINETTAGYAYEAYQIFKGTLLEETKDSVLTKTLGDIKWGDGIDADKEVEGKKLIAALQAESTFNDKEGNSLFKGCENAADVAEVVATFQSDKNKVADVKMTKFADIVSKYLTEAQGSTNKLETSGKYEMTLEAGYYLIKNTTVPTAAAGQAPYSYSRFMLEVVSSTEVTPKTDKPSVDKVIDEVQLDANGDAIKNNDGTDETVETKNNTATIGTKVPYKVTSAVPDMTGYNKYYFIMNDTMSKGLTFDDNVEIKIYPIDSDGNIDTSKDPKTLTKDTDYTVTTTEPTEEKDGAQVETGETAIKIVFKNFIQYKNLQGQKIVVTYSATLNENAVLTDAGNPNTVKLTYSNNPTVTPKGDNEPGPEDKDLKITGETPESTTKTYATGLKLTKVEKGTNDALTGAVFTITGTSKKTVKTNKEMFIQSTNGTYYLLLDGTYTEKEPTEDKTEGGVTTKGDARYYYKDANGSYPKYEKVTTVTKDTTETKINTFGKVDDRGVLTIEGLGEGTYTITEIKAPDGYNLLDKPIIIEITADETKDSAGWTVNKVVKSENPDGQDTKTSLSVGQTSGLYEMNVENSRGSVLPSTGGMGTTVIYIAGIAMIVAAGIVVIARKRMA